MVNAVSTRISGNLVKAVGTRISGNDGFIMPTCIPKLHAKCNMEKTWVSGRLYTWDSGVSQIASKASPPLCVLSAFVALGRGLCKTLERAYLLSIGGKVMERPQYMFMRVAIGIHGEDLKARILKMEGCADREGIGDVAMMFFLGGGGGRGATGICTEWFWPVFFTGIRCGKRAPGVRIWTKEGTQQRFPILSPALKLYLVSVWTVWGTYGSSVFFCRRLPSWNFHQPLIIVIAFLSGPPVVSFIGSYPRVNTVRDNTCVFFMFFVYCFLFFMYALLSGFLVSCVRFCAFRDGRRQKKIMYRELYVYSSSFFFFSFSLVL